MHNDNKVHAKIEVLKYNNKKDIGKILSCAEVGRYDSPQHTSSVTVLRRHRGPWAPVPLILAGIGLVPPGGEMQRSRR